MGEIVNLRMARKSQAREAARKAAEVNRAAFGRTKDERERTAREKSRAEAHFSAHRIENAGRGGDDA